MRKYTKEYKYVRIILPKNLIAAELDLRIDGDVKSVNVTLPLGVNGHNPESWDELAKVIKETIAEMLA